MISRWVLAFSLLLLGLLMAGCTRAAPGIETRIVHVDRLVAVPCVRGDLPPEPKPLGRIPEDARQAADRLGDKLIEVRVWGRQLTAVLLACAEKPKEAEDDARN